MTRKDIKNQTFVKKGEVLLEIAQAPVEVAWSWASEEDEFAMIAILKGDSVHS